MGIQMPSPRQPWTLASNSLQCGRPIKLPQKYFLKKNGDNSFAGVEAIGDVLRFDFTVGVTNYVVHIIC